MISKCLHITLLSLLSFATLQAQESEQLRLMFYNVENLFDIYDDSLKRDESFTPEGDNHWNWWRFNDKLQKISKNIIAIGEWDNVDIIGLAEIENRYVLEELINKTPLINAGYEIVHQESPDNRGIDVALLYSKNKLTLLEWEAIEVKFDGENPRPTRDVLYAKFQAFKKDTLHVFINHWPSRYGGQVATEPKRIRAAETVLAKVEQIQQKNPEANIVITGDLNDDPDNVSIKETLAAHKNANEADSTGLINLTANLGWNLGTHKYQGKWGVLDHMIISKSLWDNYQNLQVKDQKVEVFRAEWIFEEDKSYQGNRPYRTYLGPRYHGGFSDHLPVYIDIVKQ